MPARWWRLRFRERGCWRSERWPQADFLGDRNRQAPRAWSGPPRFRIRAKSSFSESFQWRVYDVTGRNIDFQAVGLHKLGSKKKPILLIRFHDRTVPQLPEGSSPHDRPRIADTVSQRSRMSAATCGYKSTDHPIARDALFSGMSSTMSL